jgi:hypothetical protein
MSHLYSVSQAVYNATYPLSPSPSPSGNNPTVLILGTVDGGVTVGALVWWAAIQLANAAGGASGGAAEVRKVLTPALLSAAIAVGQLVPEAIPAYPVHPIVPIPLPTTGLSNYPSAVPINAICNEGLVGSWTV